MENSNTRIIDSFIEVGRYLKGILDEDAIVSISDTQHILKYYPGYELDIKDEEGTAIKSGDVMFECINKNSKIVKMFQPKFLEFPLNQ